MVVLRKKIAHEKGQTRLFDEVRYFFYITNDWAIDAEEVVFEANDRCNQENLMAQLAGGVRALSAPVDNLLSNWAYMVMTALAWNLKAWWALSLPEQPRWRQQHQAQKHAGLADGVPHIPQCLHQDPVPDPPHGPTIGVSCLALQSAFARVLPTLHRFALLTDRLRSRGPDAPVRRNPQPHGRANEARHDATNIRRHPPTPPASGRSSMHLPTTKIQRQLSIGVRLFKA